MLFKRIKDFSQNDKSNSELQIFLLRKKELSVIINIAKTLIFLTYNYNDQIVYKGLISKDKNYISNRAKFYYSNKKEIGKGISKNCLDIPLITSGNISGQLILKKKMMELTMIKNAWIQMIY